ncbi:MocR-like pyridoxine biosynthesis transcription factor PdxR [Alkalicoccobacillus murimartini]|uniref:GntR family transcriptional regulator/MocR family aminotransferase n=1 Tax=Alkalicoccobacillus murimartini TaxID=171685 RepID=A0ABT9YHW1_9BACI|nr:PLP-dependent aminotransferase family protein [Alkalicoccobacillus murimartini]MDQ0207193.1 GntR family transcriptional regulator/MocR family aminotransferase [Alkalicoccobacillus murimartini]
MLWFPVDRHISTSLVQQVYTQIRTMILSEQLKEHEKLPSTRELADSIGVSRNTVTDAYDQLILEGYLIVKPRSGTYVAEGVVLKAAEIERKEDDLTNWLQTEQGDEQFIDFRASHPAMDHFPRKVWGRLAKEVCYDSSDELFGYRTPLGDETLRSVLTTYLARTRGVSCHPEQIVITAGATQALALITQLLMNEGEYVAVEDPVTDEMRQIFTNAGAIVKPIKADDHGIMPEKLSRDGKPSFVFVIPSHQFPLGAVLPIQRRIQLVEYVRSMNSYIVEDDYDSEFTYEGTAVFSMQGLDAKRVIYVGTFSKILSPALRIGYVILPYHLVERFKELKWFSDRHTATLEQQIMARFIEEGHLDQHVRRMKRIYEKRRKTLVAALRESFPALTIVGHAAGMHVVVEWKDLVVDDTFVKHCKQHQVIIYPVEYYALQKGYHTHQMVLGYGSLTESDIQLGVRRLREAVGSYTEDLI